MAIRHATAVACSQLGGHTDEELYSQITDTTTTGELQSVDGYMNIALEKTEEYVNGVKKRSYGDAFVRGNNGKWLISLLYTEAKGISGNTKWLSRPTLQIADFCSHVHFCRLNQK